MYMLIVSGKFHYYNSLVAQCRAIDHYRDLGCDVIVLG
jgi:hypothetical protein